MRTTIRRKAWWVYLAQHENQVMRGSNMSASLHEAWGKNGLVIFAERPYTVEGPFKVNTHNARRQSAKQGAVYLTI